VVTRIQTALFILIALLGISCKNDRYTHRIPAQPGIFISFDDRYVDEWFELRPLFKKYQARITFFVTHFDSLTTEQVEKLRILQQDGHEIGLHGAMHVLSEHYIKEHSMSDYLKQEIVAGINAMNKAGFYPTSFAYPYSAKYWGTDRELLNYFYVLRSEVPFKKDQDITSIDEIYYPFEGDRLIYSISLDMASGLSPTAVESGMKRAVSKKEVLMLYGHKPKTSFDITFLEEILRLAAKNDLKFFRASDLVK